MKLFYCYVWKTPIDITLAGRLLPANAVFYVGKGQDKRAWRKHNSAKDKDTNYLRDAAVRKIRVLGLDLVVEIIKETVSELEAFAMEIALIAQYGRIIDNVGLLTNMTMGGDGASGYKFTTEQRAHLSSIRKGMIANNKGKKRPGIGGRKKGTGWSEAERTKQMLSRTNNPRYKHSDERKERDRLARLSRPKTVKQSLGEKWYTDGIQERYFEPSAAPQGWHMGRLPNKIINKRGLLWYNDGQSNRQFRENTQPDGWNRGRVRSK
jgi:hypothetical protein